jgi:hypothetical protein
MNVTATYLADAKYHQNWYNIKDPYNFFKAVMVSYWKLPRGGRGQEKQLNKRLKLFRFNLIQLLQHLYPCEKYEAEFNHIDKKCILRLSDGITVDKDDWKSVGQCVAAGMSAKKAGDYAAKMKLEKAAERKKFMEEIYKPSKKERSEVTTEEDMNGDKDYKPVSMDLNDSKSASKAGVLDMKIDSKPAAFELKDCNPVDTDMEIDSKPAAVEGFVDSKSAAGDTDMMDSKPAAVEDFVDSKPAAVDTDNKESVLVATDNKVEEDCMDSKPASVDADYKESVLVDTDNKESVTSEKESSKEKPRIRITVPTSPQQRKERKLSEEKKARTA